MPKNIKTVEDELREDSFRVAIFGSARIKPNDKVYKDVSDLAKHISEHDIDIVTGGGPGLMEAANHGNKLAHNSHSDSIGLTIDLPTEAKGNRYLDIKKHFHKFSNRLDHFMLLSNVVVVVPGGIGTCLELFYTWQLTQVKHICHIPIILVGDMWVHLVAWVRDEIIKDGRANPEDLSNIFCVKNTEEALEIILKTKELFEAGGEEACINAMKYNTNSDDE